MRDKKSWRDPALLVREIGLAFRAWCPLLMGERGSAGSTGSEGSTGVVRRISSS